VSVCLPSNDSVKISCTLVGEFELQDVTSCSCKVVSVSSSIPQLWLPEVYLNVHDVSEAACTPSSCIPPRLPNYSCNFAVNVQLVFE
jgi:hypothetical protein